MDRIPFDDFHLKVMGVNAHRVVEGRRRGRMESREHRVYVGAKGSEGVEYWALREFDGMDGQQVICEFNPAKVDVACVGSSMGAQRVRFDLVGVDRFDVAFDFDCPRYGMTFDDRRRKIDHFAVGALGPETSRSGYRPGSRLKFQLYDKSAERRAAGCDVREHVTRFEIQCIKPSPPSASLFNGAMPASGELLRLIDLEHAEFPANDECVRLVPFNPMAAADPLLTAFMTVARMWSVRAARRWARDVVCMKRQRVDDWIECNLPMVRPSLRDLFRSHWVDGVRPIVERLRTWIDSVHG